MRKITAVLIMFAVLIAWIGLATVIGARLAHAPRWVQLVFYVVAGIGWIAPMKPLFAWMNRGAQPPEDE